MERLQRTYRMQRTLSGMPSQGKNSKLGVHGSVSIDDTVQVLTQLVYVAPDLAITSPGMVPKLSFFQIQFIVLVIFTILKLMKVLFAFLFQTYFLFNASKD